MTRLLLFIEILNDDIKFPFLLTNETNERIFSTCNVCFPIKI